MVAGCSIKDSTPPEAFCAREDRRGPQKGVGGGKPPANHETDHPSRRPHLSTAELVLRMGG